MRPDFLSPIFLGGSLGTFAAEGAQASLSPFITMNPNRVPMLIDEFIFSQANGAADVTFANASWPFSYLQADISVGGVPLTKGYTPVSVLAPRYVRGAQTDLYGTVSQELAVIWHLPKPLYVPPDVGILANFLRKSPFPVGGDPAVGVTSPVMGFWIRGRSMPEGSPIPKSIWVPWATYSQCRTQVTRFVSGDNEMINPHTQPLNVTQFLGWNCARAGTGMIPCPFTAQATFSNNKMFIRDPTPFGLLFPSDRGYFNVGAKLMNGQFARFELECVPSNNENLEGTTVGMIGYREIETPWGAK